MGLRSHRYTALSAKSRVPGRLWPIGWNGVGLSQWFAQHLEGYQPCPVQRVKKDGWTDFFLGHAVTQSSAKVHSVLEGQSKIGLHFCSEDTERLLDMRCPSSEIPSHLWHLLQQEIWLS